MIRRLEIPDVVKAAGIIWVEYLVIAFDWDITKVYGIAELQIKQGVN